MNKFFNFIVCLLALILGLGGGAVGAVYLSLPETETLTVGEEVFYTYKNSNVSTVELTGAEDEFSVHFVELGNKYTGDCTYIKYGNIDILIDCGSKSSSISAVTSYLNTYVTDNTLEYVIVTHAHQDHYAGFATTTKVDSIFDLYVCETIIDFGNACNQKEDAKTYNNYLRERNAEIEAGATYIPAIECRNENGTNREFVIDESNDVKFEVLYNQYNEYDRTNAEATKQYKADSENDYSVCTLFSYGEKSFLFTGDLEHEGEEMLVRNNNLPENIDLYKAGHHGSKTSSTATLLNVIKPKHICVCCCAGSPEYTSTINNQFPTQEFISRIVDCGSTDAVYVTTMCVDWENDIFESMNGNIVVWTNSTAEGVNVNCSNNNTKLKDTEWFNKIITDEKGVARVNRQWVETALLSN